MSIAESDSLNKMKFKSKRTNESKVKFGDKKKDENCISDSAVATKATYNAFWKIK